MADTDAASQDAAFSRSTGLPPSMGKATADLKTKVPEGVKEDFAALARRVGSTESELLRDMVMVRLYGHEHVARMYEQRLRFAAGNVPESAATGGDA